MIKKILIMVVFLSSFKIFSIDLKVYNEGYKPIQVKFDPSEKRISQSTRGQFEYAISMLGKKLDLHKPITIQVGEPLLIKNITQDESLSIYRYFGQSLEKIDLSRIFKLHRPTKINFELHIIPEAIGYTYKINEIKPKTSMNVPENIEKVEDFTTISSKEEAQVYGARK